MRMEKIDVLYKRPKDQACEKRQNNSKEHRVTSMSHSTFHFYINKYLTLRQENSSETHHYEQLQI